MIAPVDVKHVAKKGGQKAADATNDARAIVNRAESRLVENAAAQQLSEAQIAAALTETPTVTERVLGGADKVANVAGFVPMLPMLTGFLFGSVPKKIGQWTRWKGLENTGVRVKNFHEGINEATFAEVGDRMGIRKQVGAGAEAVAGVAGNVTGWLSRVTGLGRWRRDSNIGSFAGSMDDARKTLSQLDAHIGELHPEVQKHVLSIKESLNAAHVPAASLQTVGAGVGHSIPTEALHPHLGSVSHPNIESIKGSMSKLNDLLHNGMEVVKDGKPAREAIVATESKAVGKMFNKFSKQMNKAVGHHNDAIHWQNPGASIKSLPKRIGGTSAMEGVMHGSFIAGSGISMVSDAHSFMGKIQTLKQMYADMHGTKPENISTLKILLGGVPKTISDARWKMVKSLFVSEAADAVGMAVNIKGAKAGNNWGFIKSSMAYMVPGMVSGAYVSSFGETWEPIAKQLGKLHKAGVAIPAEGYESLLRAASPELQARKQGDQFVAAIAAKYAAEKIGPAEVLKRIDDGRVMYDIHKLREEYAAAHPANEAKGSHAARVGKKNGVQHSVESRAAATHTERLEKNPQTGMTPGLST